MELEKPDKCINCGKDLYCTEPFNENGIKGFKSKPHGCPAKYDHTEIFLEKHDEVNKVLKELAENENDTLVNTTIN